MCSSDLLISNDLKDFPSATFMLAECDSFVDEGRLYAEKLRAAGVAVEINIEPGQVHHVFPWAGAFSAGPRMIDHGARALGRALGSL